MTDNDRSGEHVSFLRDRGSLAVIGLVIVIAIAGTAYGYHTQEDSEPGLTLDDIPDTADGTYAYTMTIGIGTLHPAMGMIATYADGAVSALTIDGEAVTAEDLETMVAQFEDGLGGSSVVAGTEWTDGSETVGTFLVTYGSGTVVYAEDGRVLNIQHSGTNYTLEVNLDGWGPVTTGAEE